MSEDKYKIISSYEMKSIIDSQKDDSLKVWSKFPHLDQYIDGFVPGELITISGATKSGKTLFAVSLTKNFVEQNFIPLWFSFEVAPKYFLRLFPELPLFYLPKNLKMGALDWVLFKIREGLRKYNTRIIFIDHLHYLFDMARVKNPSIEIGQVIRRLKLFAVNNDLIIFLMAHTTKGASNEEKGLSYEAIRDSSLVAQESDSVFMIRRNKKEPDSNKAKLRIEFHRRTGVLEKIVELVKKDGYLVEVDYEDDSRLEELY